MADSTTGESIVTMESPFALSEEIQKSFEGCATLRAVCIHLSEDSANDFCALHSSLPPSTQQTWLLNRDVLHALIVPIAALYHRTALLAEAALCSSRQEDFELAFHGDARSAFLSLQCFVHEEESWCYSRGCPACTTLHTLETESTIRLAITAALMAESSSASAPGGGGVQLSAFLPALQRATEDDEFWDPSFWAYFYTKASALRDAIHALIAQASELEVLVLSPRPGRSPISSPVHSPERSPVKSRTLNLEMRTASPTRNAAAMNGNGQRIVGMPRLEPSPLAKQQAKLDQEQRAMLNRAAWQVYSAVGMPPAERIALRAQARRRGMEELGLSARGRSLTA